MSSPNTATTVSPEAESRPHIPSLDYAEKRGAPQTQSESEYSGQSQEGLTVEGSYDRMIFQDRNEIYTLQSLATLVRDLNITFQGSERSRLVIRVLADPSIQDTDLAPLSRHLEGAEIDLYPDSEGRFNYLTICSNKPERAIDSSAYQLITTRVHERIRQLYEGRTSFENEALATLARSQEAHMRPTQNIDEQELTRIWEPFGWTREAVRNLLTSDHNDQLMGMRNENGELMAVALYNDQSHNGIQNGETTEWTTAPQFGGQGVIQPLLITFHAYLLSEGGIDNIWADLRTPDPRRRMPNSIAPAVRSGMRVFHSTLPHIASNHVTIEGDPQSYNEHSDQVFGDTPQRDLRSFVRGWVDRNQFTQRLTDECLDYITLPS